jgi:transposase
MFQLSAATRIYLATGVTDMRKSFDTLCGVVRSWQKSDANRDADEAPQAGNTEADPLDGSLFVFCNRRRDRIKVLFFDGSGLWVCAKRLERGTFSWPGPESGADCGQCVITQQELALVLGGVDMSATRRRRWWRRP